MSSDDDFKGKKSQKHTQRNKKKIKNGEQVSLPERKKTKIDTVVKKSIKTTKKHPNDEDVKSEDESDNYCPFCLVPFSCLSTIDSPSWHISLCPVTSKSTVECKDGRHCTSIIPIHYSKFLHSELAFCKDSGMSNTHKIEMIEVEDNNLTDISLNPEIASVQGDIDSKNEIIIVKDEISNISISNAITLTKNTHNIHKEEIPFYADPPETLYEDESCKNTDNQHTSLQPQHLGNIIEIEDDLVDNFVILGTPSVLTLATTTPATMTPVLTPVSITVSPPVSTPVYITCKGSAQSIKQSLLTSYFKSNSPTKTGGGCVKQSKNNNCMKSVEKSNVTKSNQPLNLTNPAVKQISTSTVKHVITPTVKQVITPTVKQVITPTVTQVIDPVVKPVGNPAINPPLPYSTSTQKSEKTQKPQKPRKSKNNPRPCPFYKWIPDTSFTVDAFSFRELANCSVYFLSHFHADHYKGLTKNFSGRIVCSRVTANLITTKLNVDPTLITSCNVDESLDIEGVTVTLIEANHCPGAVLFLFKKDANVHLHTGDFRADSAMLEHPALKRYRRDIQRRLQLSTLFLDTTYCKPEYSFPPQQQVIDFAIGLSVDFVSRHPRALVVSGTYTIGKERIFMAIAEALRRNVCVRKDKMDILKCLEEDRIDKLMTLDPVKGKLHVLPMNMLNKMCLVEYLSKLKHCYDCILAFKPTGWTFKQYKSNQPVITNDDDVLTDMKPVCDSNGVTIYGVPYSEHSSYSELKMFVQAFQPAKVIPTVNVGNTQVRDDMQKHFQQWMGM